MASRTKEEKITIGVLSDTHGLLREGVVRQLRGCDYILHGGDINTREIINRLQSIAETYVVRGNNDKDWAADLPQFLDIKLADVSIYMTHKKKDLPEDLSAHALAIVGHTHKYLMQETDGTLLLNPGSCGPRRPDQEITLAKVIVQDGKIKIKKIVVPPEA